MQTLGGLRAANNLCCSVLHLKMPFLPSLFAIPKTFQLLKQLKVLFSGSFHGTSCEFLMFLVAINLYKQFNADLIASLTVAVMLQESWSQLEQGNTLNQSKCACH